VILFWRFGEREKWLDTIPSGLRHGVVPALAKGLATAKPVHAEITAFDRPVAFQGLQGIG
jgi:hypothetical protein